MSVGNSDEPVTVAIAWTKQTSRATDLAGVVDGLALQTDPAISLRWRPAPVRWALSALQTIRFLRRARPQVVIVQNPPIFAPMVAYCYCRLNTARNARFILDSHPASFGLKGQRIWGYFLPIHGWLTRRAAATLVTTGPLARQVTAWGGRPLILHEPPPEGGAREFNSRERSTFSTRESAPAVLFACVFAEDEPVDVVVEAARRVPEVEVWITGNPSLAPSGVLDDLPPNVKLTGFVPKVQFDELMMASDAVLSLTTEPNSVMRSAYEAVYASRHLIVTDFPNLTELFPLARHVSNDVRAIESALREVAAGDSVTRATLAAEAVSLQNDRWMSQRRALIEIIGPTL